jgi:transcriptional accessory protein Tex/SPT6
MLASIQSRLAAEVSARPQQIAAAVDLLDEGATVPFIARYRKEATCANWKNGARRSWKASSRKAS